MRKGSGQKLRQVIAVLFTMGLLCFVTGCTKQQATGSDENFLEDLFVNYVKEVTEGDIVLDEEGLYYVKNQILVSTELGTPQVVMWLLADRIGAEIVGYIDIIDEYQMEFRINMSSEELTKIAEILEGFPFVDYAGLNLVIPSGPQEVFYY